MHFGGSTGGVALLIDAVVKNVDGEESNVPLLLALRPETPGVSVS
jgi:hypothetical protein